MPTKHSNASKSLVKLDGKIVGEITDATFKKTIRGSRHMLRQPPGIAIQASIFEDLKARGIQRIRVLDAETDVEYSVSLAVFEACKFEVNRGHGRQLACPLERFQVKHLAQLSLFRDGGSQ